MPVDDDHPASRLPARVEQEQFIQHFPAAFGVRVDVDGLDVVQEREHVSFEGARLPEPPRIVVLPSRGTARYGNYLNGIIRLRADASWRRTRDGQFGGNYSLFTTTLLHEVGHAVYERWLTDEQRRRMADLYLNWFIRRQPPGIPEPSARGAEHFFVALFSAAVLRADTEWGTTREAREFLDALGVRID